MSGLRNAVIAFFVFATANGATQGSGLQDDIAPLASRSMLLDGARAGSRIVVVGDHGHILLSDDAGKNWRQAQPLTRVLLTGVYFVDARLGWAVGHDEVILHTEDGGERWRRVHEAPQEQQPLLDVWFKDANVGLAVGAYGTILRTQDGGKTWARQPFEPTAAPRAASATAITIKPLIDEGSPAGDRHLNKIMPAQDGTLYLAAEAGYLFRSVDGGASWITLPSPYDGSFFGLLPLQGAALLAFGLRGHLFRSNDGGQSWRPLTSHTVAMLTDAVQLQDGVIAISGLAGTLLVSRDGGYNFELRQQRDQKGIQAVLAVPSGQLLTIGESGVQRVSVASGDGT